MSDITVECSSEIARLHLALNNVIEAARSNERHHATTVRNLQIALNELRLEVEKRDATIARLQSAASPVRAVTLEPAAKARQEMRVVCNHSGRQRA